MKTFTTKTYTIHTDKIQENREVCFAVLADLHGITFGNNHQQLFHSIMKEKPDGILVPGDMIVSRDPVTLQAAAGLFLRLCEQVPVFYSLGNHEYKMLCNPDLRDPYLNYERLLTSAGVCFLHNEHITSRFHGTSFTFYGLELPLEYYHKPNSPALSLTSLEQLIGTPSRDGVHVLLAHNPKYGNTYFSWGADMILSGHYHGGILRLGENYGLTCPQYLFLPPFCCGRFTRGRQNMIVSPGLGEHTVPVRIHNPRELIILRLCGSKRNSRHLDMEGN